MKIYLFDINTKRYIKEGEAIPNPENKSNPHIPAYGTVIAPPVCGECEAAYFINGEWVIKPCYYGKKAVNIESKTVETVYYEGELKSGFQYVDTETAAEIAENPDRYQEKDGKLVRLSDSEYSEYLQTKEKEAQTSEIKSQLAALDAEAVRPLRAILAGTQTDEDVAKIQEIETQALELRTNLKALS